MIFIARGPYMPEIDSPFVDFICSVNGHDPLEAKKADSIYFFVDNEQTKCSELAGYRQIKDNFELDLRNRVFLSELDSKEPKDNELERLTMFSTVDIESTELT
ncbi:hypothetical protein Glove_661g54 [Diversispora epigaea]|uniref:Uncharacterized protein n=1 Tax=Diversispora epigaea TaxID=1348612 RepID=A0A397G512_9GLOM|nr:hypothetical protein Glove_661g54 [Diversispora epigaea]